MRINTDLKSLKVEFRKIMFYEDWADGRVCSGDRKNIYSWWNAQLPFFPLSDQQINRPRLERLRFRKGRMKKALASRCYISVITHVNMLLVKCFEPSPRVLLSVGDVSRTRRVSKRLGVSNLKALASSWLTTYIPLEHLPAHVSLFSGIYAASLWKSWFFRVMQKLIVVFASVQIFTELHFVSTSQTVTAHAHTSDFESYI